MSGNYIRLCPVCDRENPTESTRCECGTSLLGVDFSMRAPAIEIPAASPSNNKTQTTPAPEDALLLPPALTAELGQVLCPYMDCAQPTPGGMERCLYCNRPLLTPLTQQPNQQTESLQRLPSALRVRYRALELLPTGGTEADLMLVETLTGPVKRIVKLYRQGIESDAGMLEKLTQSGDPHIIHIVESGVANGVRFEVMEYFPLGNLRQLLNTGPMPLDRIRAIVSDIAQALKQVHAMNILHRDLKPENILVRSLAPLSLVLTDFGIASLRMGTQHFTDGARTTRYAAPEALTGVIDDRADWWSLGMIVLEAAVGQHPFEGLNEQVVNHHLATKPIDVRTVFHDGLRKLCRGLLLRDPRSRWSWPEVQRWLADDPTLTAPEEGAVSSAVRPYKIGDSQCSTAIELAATLIKHWDIGTKDIARGTVATWLEEQLHDHNLLRKLQDIMDVRGASNDWRLLKFVIAVAPDMPAVWKGLPLNRESLLIAARKASNASNADYTAAAWLHSIHSEAVLEALDAADQHEIATFRKRWLEGLKQFDALWLTAREAEDRWRRAPKDWYGSSQVVVDVDYALYLQTTRMSPPAVDRLHGHILLAVNLPAYVALSRANLTSTLLTNDDVCPWFSALGPVEQLDGVGIVVAQLLLPFAQEDKAREEARLSAAQQPDKASSDESAATLLREIKNALDLVRQSPRSLAQRSALQAALPSLQAAGFRFIRLASAEPIDMRVKNSLDSLMNASIALQAELNNVDAIDQVNAIWFQPERLMIGLALLMGVWILVSGLAASLLLAALTIGAVWRMRLVRTAQSSLDEKINSFKYLCEKSLPKQEPVKSELKQSPKPVVQKA